MSRAFCIGNGESRKGFDLEQLRPHGKIYGCNALYRDFTPDVLVAVDHGVCHEIYNSGYCQKNEAWFRDWTKVPAMHYEMMIYGAIDKITRDEIKDYYDDHIENKRTNADEFVFHGSNLSGLAKIIQSGKAKGKTKEVIKKTVSHSAINVSWMNKPDYSNNITDLIENYKKDLGWAAGATSGRIAVEQIKDLKEVFLIGHDLWSTNHLVNNIYKGTKHYVSPENGRTPADNWILQWNAMFTGYPNIKFYKVNEKPVGTSDDINVVIDGWRNSKNVEYITYPTMLDILSK